MPSNDPLFTIILAGGKGSRMRSRDRHKVCFDVAGVPAIVRAIDAYNLLGVTQNVVVVGEMAASATSSSRISPKPWAPATPRGAACGPWRAWTTGPASWWWLVTKSSRAPR
jgi:CTP:molybdopterin cytidylyltransferase MocA